MVLSAEEQPLPHIISNNKMAACAYCGVMAISSNPKVRLPLRCYQCNGLVHLSCLREIKPPPALLGDELYKFCCATCSSVPGSESCQRLDLNWVHVIHLAVYNLILTEKGREGFFRWNTDICRFIENHWSQLLPNRRKTTSWQSTVAGIISVNSPALFCSGTQQLGESGWWTLQKVSPPQLASVLKLATSLTHSSTIEELHIPTIQPSEVQEQSSQSKISQAQTKSQEEPQTENSALVRLTERQERMLADHLKQVCSKLDSKQQNSKVKRLYRKLVVRQLYRNHGIDLFSSDAVVKQSLDSGHDEPLRDTLADLVDRASVQAKKILDRTTAVALVGQHNSSATNHGQQCETITSPLTSRVLVPCIYRSFEFFSLRVQLFQELVKTVNKFEQYQPKCLEFSYFQQHHLKSINSFLSHFFWPVNLKEYLQYPDFSVVVTYGKLIIGCGFMTPDVKVTESYISFLLVHPDFRKAGIGKVILYHLVQSCLGKDVTLHVSIDNPAMLLYQQFGFKSEQLCLDFYDKYYPPGYHHSKHAYLMRLRR